MHRTGRWQVITSVGPAEILEKLQVLGVILKNKAAAKLLCVKTLEGFSHEAIRCYTFRFSSCS